MSTLNMSGSMDFAVDAFIPGVEWEAGEREAVLAALKRIDAYASGEIVEDYPISDEALASYRASQLKAALDRRAVLYAQALNINGRAYARGATGGAFYSSALSELAERPSFAGYVGQILQKGMCFSDALERGKTVGKAIAIELDYVADGLKQSAAPLPKVTLASDISATVASRKKRSEIQTLSHPGMTGRLLPGALYHSALVELLDGARQRIDILMFFMSTGGSNHPVNKLIAKLTAAQKRGVAVRVLLDKDREGEIYKSRQINKRAHELLKQGGVSVKWDTVSSLTHSKVVVVDGSWVLIGSHNWTASSLFAYSETSVAVKDEKVAQNYLAHIDRRFEGR